jgi:hypothetical protein
MMQRDFLDLLAPAEPFHQVDTIGDAEETLVLTAPRMACPRAQIELYLDCETGRWMWATAYHLAVSGGGYRVGPKWGKFAATRDGALRQAQAELHEKIADRTCAPAAQIRTWLAQLMRPATN